MSVIDSSPETLDLNRDRVGRPDVDYLVADLFTWQPQRTYDVVFFSFRLSHVPRSRFSASGPWCGPVLLRGVGCSSSTTATTGIQLARSGTPTPSIADRILSSAACTTEPSTRSSRYSTSPRSCSRFLATKVGEQGSVQHAGSSSVKRAWLRTSQPVGPRPGRPAAEASTATVMRKNHHRPARVPRDRCGDELHAP